MSMSGSLQLQCHSMLMIGFLGTAKKNKVQQKDESRWIGKLSNLLNLRLFVWTSVCSYTRMNNDRLNVNSWHLTLPESNFFGCLQSFRLIMTKTFFQLSCHAGVKFDECAEKCLKKIFLLTVGCEFFNFSHSVPFYDNFQTFLISI